VVNKGSKPVAVYRVRLPATVTLETATGFGSVHSTSITFRVEADDRDDAAQRLGKILGGQESYRLEHGVYRR
jgi:hypothetical protein